MDRPKRRDPEMTLQGTGVQTNRRGFTETHWDRGTDVRLRQTGQLLFHYQGVKLLLFRRDY